MSRLRRLKNELFTTGIYKSRDFISNFKIKVKLEKIVNADLKCKKDEPEQPEVELQPILPKDDVEIEEKIFSWQEKVFSEEEFEKYSNVNKCITTLEKKYHKDVTKLKKNGFQCKRLFTITNSEESVNVIEGKENILQSANDNYLTDKKNLHFSESIPKSNLIQKHSGERSQPVDTQSMTVLADVTENENLECPRKSVVLCTISYFTDGTLTVTPDFSRSGGEPYEFEVENQERTIFRYHLEHVSSDISSEELEKEKKIYQELHTRQVDIVKKAVGEEFEMPSANFLKVFIFGEIVSARDFGWKNVYVNYILDLPPHWKVANEDQQLSGSTLTASTKVNNIDDVAYFSYPLSIELNLDIQLSKIECLTWPQLLIQVWSKDYWNRYRIEGYGHVNIPCTPGIYKWRVETWQPISNSIVGQLRQFFLGAQQELDDLAFPAAATQKCHPLNRVGIRTQSNGSVDIKMQIVQQSLDFLQTDASGVSLKKILSGLGSVSIRSSVVTVLEAFQRARHRMLKARESLVSSSSLIDTTTTCTTFESSETCKSTKSSSLTDICEGMSESSSSGVIQTVAIIHKSDDTSCDNSSEDETSGKTCSSGEKLTSDDLEASSSSVNQARVRRRQQKKVHKLPPLSR